MKQSHHAVPSQTWWALNELLIDPGLLTPYILQKKNLFLEDTSASLSWNHYETHQKEISKKKWLFWQYEPLQDQYAFTERSRPKRLISSRHKDLIMSRKWCSPRTSTVALRTSDPPLWSPPCSPDCLVKAIGVREATGKPAQLEVRQVDRSGQELCE